MKLICDCSLCELTWDQMKASKFELFTDFDFPTEGNKCPKCWRIYWYLINKKEEK